MASIKLKGDTSGEVIISAPSVAGASTLELQATNGTIATTADINTFYNSLGNRNLIINGDMRIAQRGTSKTGITSNGYYTCDRYRVSIVSTGTWTQSQDTDVPTGQGFANSFKMQCTTADAGLAASDVCVLNYRMEGQNLQHLKKGTANAESLTLSFWVKSNKTGTYILELYDADNSRTISQSYSINTSDTWEKKTLTFFGDTIGTLNNDNGNSLQAYWWFAGGSDWSSGTLATSWQPLNNPDRAVGNVNLADSTANYINITGVQLEVGTEATPFEHRPYDIELQKCMRYYQRIQGGAAFTSGVNGVYNDTRNLIGLHQYIVPFRASPTFSYSAISHFDLEPFDTQPTTLTANTSGNLYQASVTGNDPTARVRGYGGTITCDNGAGYFDFSAEL
jgi:hypothetical protein